MRRKDWMVVAVLLTAPAVPVPAAETAGPPCLERVQQARAGVAEIRDQVVRQQVEDGLERAEQAARGGRPDECETAMDASQGALQEALKDVSEPAQPQESWLTGEQKPRPAEEQGRREQ